MNIDFVSVLLFLGVGQCIFIMSSILAGTQRNQLGNQLLFVLLFSFLWFQIEFFFIRHKLDTDIPFIYATRYGSWLIVGPLILLYNHAVLNENFKFQKKDFNHFLPFLTLAIIIPVAIDGFVTNRATRYGMLTVFDSWNQEVITFKHYFYGIIFVAQFFHAGVYILVAYLETNKMIATAKQTQSNIPFSKTNSLKYLHALAVIIIVFCSVFVIYQFMTSMWRRNLDYFYVLPTMIFVFGLAYRALRYPNSILLMKSDVPTIKYEKSGLTEMAKEVYLKKLEFKLEREKVYRNNELRLTDLATSLGISNHHLSQIINENKKQNFFDFINSYRIKEAKDQILSGSSPTLLEVAFTVGFNNKNSFNSAFKKHVGMTPSAFKSSL